MAQMDALAFETAEEVLGNGVVIRVALAGHTLPDTEFRETQSVSAGGILDAAVRVEDEARIGLGTLISRPTTSLFVNCIYAVEPPCTGRYARWCERPAGLCAPPTRLSCAALLTYAALHPRCVVPYFLLVFRFSAFRAGFPASTFIFLIFLLHHKILNLDTPAASLLQAPEGFEKRAARRQALAALLRFSKK